MSSSNKPLSPKADRLNNSNEGQAFDHELDSSRDWEQTLDVLHNLLVQKVYYIAIATNTKGGLFNPVMKKGINIKRIKKEIPEELQLVLKMRMDTFGELDQRIMQKSLSGGNKDIWHFRSQWKEFPKGTSIIEVHQRPLWNILSSETIFRKAFIVLDGQAEVEAQNQAMFIVSKVLHNKEFCDKRFKELGKKVVKEGKIKKRPRTIYTGRPPGAIILLLKETFGIHVRTVSIEERVALGYYFEKLRLTGELDESHKELLTKLKRYFKTEDLRKID